MSGVRLRSALLVLLALGAVAAGTARADGDPASDVLYSQPAFVPEDAAASPVDAARLAALLREARRGGFPVKVAIVASSYDLGSVTALWLKPQTYARFLGTELSLLYRGRLLVVMPNGLGLYRGGRPVARERAELRGLPVVRGALTDAATTAVIRLAAANGVRLALPPPPKAAPSARARSSWAPWVAFVAGLVLVAAAWAVSLRRRPLRG